MVAKSCTKRAQYCVIPKSSNFLQCRYFLRVWGEANRRKIYPKNSILFNLITFMDSAESLVERSITLWLGCAKYYDVVAEGLCTGDVSYQIWRDAKQGFF